MTSQFSRLADAIMNGPKLQTPEVNTSPRCLLDMDGVIADFHRGIAKKFNVPFNWKTPGSICLEECLGIPNKDWWKPCDYDFWCNLEKTPEADGIVRLIEQYFKLEDVCVVTSFGNYHDMPVRQIGEVTAGKLGWLTNNYPQFKRFSIGSGKPFHASSRSYLLDDWESHVEDFFKEGGRGIVVPRPWNSRHDLPVLDNLKDWLNYYLGR